MPTLPSSFDRKLRNRPGQKLLQSRLAATFARFSGDGSGGIAVTAALLMPVMVLGMGLGAETGYQYMTQRTLQHAADLAAHAGGVRLRAGDGKTAIDAAALHVAKVDGFSVNDGNFTLNTPPASGPNAGDARSVEVLLTKTQPRFFSAIIDSEPVLIGARAVAKVTPSGSTACVLALAPTAPKAITVSGTTDVSLEGCDVASNSNASDSFYMANSQAKLTVGCVQAVGQAQTNAYLTLLDCPEPVEFAPVVQDPYADILEPDTNIPCETDVDVSEFNPTYTLSNGVSAMKFCNGLDIKKNVTFKPGLYIIDGGDFTLNSNGTISSSEVSVTTEGATFYLTGSATIKFNGNSTLNLQAPTTGPYSGILVFASRSQDGLSHEIIGNFNSTTQGAIYAPTSSISFSGNSKTNNGCTQVIGLTVEFTGNSTLRSNCSVGNARNIETNVTVSIVE